jgi:hypothetical protein
MPLCLTLHWHQHQHQHNTDQCASASVEGGEATGREEDMDPAKCRVVLRVGPVKWK